MAGHVLLSERFPARLRSLCEGPLALAPHMRVREYVFGLAAMCADGGNLSDAVMAGRIQSYSELVRVSVCLCRCICVSMCIDVSGRV
jgi:hypothetical protein